MFYIVVTLLGQYAKAEEHRARGRADMVVETKETVYVFEFKLNGTAEEALRQVENSINIFTTYISLKPKQSD